MLIILPAASCQLPAAGYQRLLSRNIGLHESNGGKGLLMIQQQHEASIQALDNSSVHESWKLRILVARKLPEMRVTGPIWHTLALQLCSCVPAPRTEVRKHWRKPSPIQSFVDMLALGMSRVPAQSANSTQYELARVSWCSRQVHSSCLKRIRNSSGASH